MVMCMDYYKSIKELLINNELSEEVEFQIMTQEDYERMEKEKLFIKFDKMFYESQV